MFVSDRACGGGCLLLGTDTSGNLVRSLWHAVAGPLAGKSGRDLQASSAMSRIRVGAVRSSSSTLSPSGGVRGTWLRSRGAAGKQEERVGEERPRPGRSVTLSERIPAVLTASVTVLSAAIRSHSQIPLARRRALRLRFPARKPRHGRKGEDSTRSIRHGPTANLPSDGLIGPTSAGRGRTQLSARAWHRTARTGGRALKDRA